MLVGGGTVPMMARRGCDLGAAAGVLDLRRRGAGSW
jgi:hypothetical protein